MKKKILADIKHMSPFRFEEKGVINGRGGGFGAEKKGIWIFLTTCDSVAPNLVNIETGFASIFDTHTFYEKVSLLEDPDKYAAYAVYCRKSFWESASPLMSFDAFTRNK